MGWDVVQIGLRHNLPVNDPFATAKEVAKRMNRNVRLVYRNEYEYDKENNVVREVNGCELIELGKFEVNNSNDYLKMTVSDYQAHQIQEIAGIDKLRQATFVGEWADSILSDIEGDPFELYEIEDNDETLDIRIFKENVNLDVCIRGRWHWWEDAFHSSRQEKKEWLHNYRMKIYHQAKMFGCNEVIICADQGPTELIYDNMDYLADNLKEYARSFQYLKDSCWVEEYKKEEWKKNAKHITFSSYFHNQLDLSNEDFVEVIYDDFSDIENSMSKLDDELIQGCKRFLDDMKRVEFEKKKKEEEERKASKEREARRKYWAQQLYSDKHQAMTIIIPEDSKLKK